MKALCDSYGFSLGNLAEPGTLLKDRPTEAVTFVENHDIARTNPIINDKMLAYAFILTHEGYPCVFWQDFFNLQLGKENSPNGIAALVKIHEQNAGGTTKTLCADDNLYIMQRNGTSTQPGLIFVLNNLGDAWGGKWVETKWKNVRFKAVAWGSHENNVEAPMEKLTQSDGWCEFFAPPRGYAVYIPQDA